MITKKAALHQFIADRIMGNLPVAKTEMGVCVYDYSVNQGCAIGRMLQLAGVSYDPCWDAIGAGGGNIESVFRKFPELKTYFEDPDSNFWTLLQITHDRGESDRPNEAYKPLPPDMTILEYNLLRVLSCLRSEEKQKRATALALVY